MVSTTQFKMGNNKTQPIAIQIDETSLSWKIFMAFISDGQISVTKEELLLYASKDLNIALDKLPPGLIESLPIILVAFMNMWSGWHFKGEFLAGKFQKEHYFQRFQKFMSDKINYTILDRYESAVKALGDQAKTQMKSILDQEFLPYTISIRCPAHVLNTIVFSDNGDDVIMKQHLGNAWQELTFTQLLNWPHTEVTFKTRDLYFVRRQATEFVRYLNFLPHESNKYEKTSVDYAEKLGKQECYSFDYFEKYIKVYVEALETIPQMSAFLLFEIQTILGQFLEDIKFIDVNKSMATNTGVLFRLSLVPFIRNKKLVKNPEGENDDTRVGYCEIITPKVYLLLHYFKPEQLDTPHLSFEYTDKIKKNPTHNYILPKISYKCTFCKMEYNSKREIMEHLKAEHKMEQHVRCTLCKKQFDVLNLAACRWRHKCIL